MVHLCKGQDVIWVRLGLCLTVLIPPVGFSACYVSGFCPLLLRSWFGVLIFDSNCIFAWYAFSPPPAPIQVIKKKKKNTHTNINRSNHLDVITYNQIVAPTSHTNVFAMAVSCKLFIFCNLIVMRHAIQLTSTIKHALSELLPNNTWRECLNEQS